MNTKFFIISMLLLSYNLFSVSVKAQEIDDIKKKKQEKLRNARNEVFENKWVAGYYGGTKALYGVSFYTMFSSKPGLYLSYRGGSEKSEDYTEFYDKKIALNVGITTPLFYPVAGYIAAGVGDYDTYTPKIYPVDGSTYLSHEMVVAVGAETSAGLIFHVKKVKIQGGVSFVNFKYPDVTFGVGYSLF